MSHSKPLILLLFAVALAGCGSPTLPDPEPTDTTGDAGANTDAADDDRL